MKRAPIILVILRAICAPVLIIWERAGGSGFGLAAVVSLAFVSDVFDGVIARRVGVATDSLRAADTMTDTVFYISATVALFNRNPEVLRDVAIGLGALIALELTRLVVELARFGRMAAYHMWSAKAWGIMLWLGFGQAFLTAGPSTLLRFAVITGLLADLEGLIASLVLSTWHRDVPSVWHALKIEAASQ